MTPKKIATANPDSETELSVHREAAVLMRRLQAQLSFDVPARLFSDFGVSLSRCSKQLV